MATTSIELAAGGGWTSLVLHTDDTCLIDNKGGPILITYASLATTPAATVPGHTVGNGEATIRLAPGGIWGRSASDRLSTVTVSK